LTYKCERKIREKKERERSERATERKGKGWRMIAKDDK
jgi:hypothetical protein